MTHQIKDVKRNRYITSPKMLKYSMLPLINKYHPGFPEKSVAKK